MTWAQANVLWGGDTVTMLDVIKGIECVQDESRDDELSWWLEAAGKAAENYCGTVLYLQPVIDRYAKSKSPVQLTQWPTDGTLTSVTLDGDDVTDDWKTYIENGVAWASNSRTIRSCTFKQLDIAYSAGYDPLPADLANVICRIAINYGNQSGGPVKKENIVGVGSIEYIVDDMSGGAFTPVYAAILDPYRRLYA